MTKYTSEMMYYIEIELGSSNDVLSIFSEMMYYIEIELVSSMYVYMLHYSMAR